MLSCVEWLGEGRRAPSTVIARSPCDEAIHLAVTNVRMNCFASLAMTEDTPSRSRDALRPRLAIEFPYPPDRGRRECRVRAAPAVSCTDCAKKVAHEHTGQRRTSDIPCAMALRLISCSPQSGRARCHCRSLEALASSELDASKRGVRTTRLYRTPLSRSSIATSASTASHPALMTIAKRPSYRDGTRSIYSESG
jgi:hypothetical protein